ncbi:MAG: T9SS type A sorting domain-containing protein, partial [Bacteroidales bacterium]|nr:T9SS type A sorting domain-containing protein [Bacteroidales bacterium]
FYDSQNDEYSIEIINMVGKTVYKKQNVKQGNTSIDIRENPKGIYLVKVQAGGIVYSEKVVYK